MNASTHPKCVCACFAQNNSWKALNAHLLHIKTHNVKVKIPQPDLKLLIFSVHKKGDGFPPTKIHPRHTALFKYKASLSMCLHFKRNSFPFFWTLFACMYIWRTCFVLYHCQIQAAPPLVLWHVLQLCYQNFKSIFVH